MKRYLLTILLVLLCVTPLFAQDGVNEGNLRTLTILHTNDTHANTLPDKNDIGGYASIATCIKQVKSEQDDVLVIDGGDTITGTPVSTYFQGDPIFRIYNTIPYDCGVLGNHEFDHGWDRIKKFRKLSRMPLLCANIYTPKGKLLGDDPVKYFKKNKIRIGIIGVTTPDLYRVTSIKVHKGLEVLDSVDTVNEYLPEVKRKSDLVIVLSHCGIEEDERMAAKLKGVDLIIGGHSHTRLQQPEKINNILIIQAGSYSKYVGRLDLVVNTDKDEIVKYDGQLISVDNEKYPPDPKTQKYIDKWEEKVSDFVDIEIGYNSKSKPTEELTDIIGQILKQKYGTDYGYHNRGGTRARLPEGTITKRNIWNMLPFGNTIVVLKVNGDAVRKYIHQNPSGPDDKLYTVATNSYVGDKAIEELGLKEEYITRHDETIRDAVIEYIEKTGSMESPESTDLKNIKTWDSKK